MAFFHKSLLIWLKHLYIGSTSGVSTLFYPYQFHPMKRGHVCTDNINNGKR
ncbi:hypothetical protein HanIR_Chr17g0896231 [Helianthus annuus]|nr:hypothetical protein HanIR_Chr17g0896231 [Helianthus annuus]